MEEGNDISPEKTGRTTRLADKYIQRFFKEPKYTPIVINDHGGYDYDKNVKLLHRILNRIKAEHPNSKPLAYTDAVCVGDDFYLKYHVDPPKECVIIRCDDPMEEYRRGMLKIYNEHQLEAGKEGKRCFEDIRCLLAPLRATGRTTRDIDDAIQKFFSLEEGESIEIRYHYGDGRSSNFMLRRIVGRLKNEHPDAKFKIVHGIYPKIVRL